MRGVPGEAFRVGESPSVLADFPDPDTDAATRKLLTEAAGAGV